MTAGLRAEGLVLYKGRPARVKAVTEARLDIDTGGQTRRVRPKDVTLLHPGPCDLARLDPPVQAEPLESVRELLAEEGDAVPLAMLAELLYGEDSPAAVWGAWQQVADGLHFEPDGDGVRARSAEQVAAERARRAEAEARAAAWEGFLERLRAGACEPDDEPFLREVEAVAEGRRQEARPLKALGRPETPESAHALLLGIGWWPVTRLPQLVRAGVERSAPDVPLAPPAAGERVDLTHLHAFAIDDAGNRDPDDAVSIDADGDLWVHVADVAALVPPDSAADVEARARGATLYLPTGPVPMLPPAAVPELGLGLADDSVGPALSFRLRLDDDGALTDVEVAPSRVRVQRLSYADAEPRLGTDPELARIDARIARFRARRLAAGAVELDWPEVRVRVDPGDAGGAPVIDLESLPALRSRTLVAECMILAGAGAAWWAGERGVSFPYSVQEATTDEEAPHPAPTPGDLVAAYALRRRQQPARVSAGAGPHRGLGLPAYGRATSPLRRAVDLIVHQQLRALVTTGAPAFDETALMERATVAETAALAVRRAERQANRHWTLVWLSQRDWRGRGVLVDVRGRRGLLVLPELGQETWVNCGEGAVPGTVYEAALRGVDLPRLEMNLELTPA